MTHDPRDLGDLGDARDIDTRDESYEESRDLEDKIKEDKHETKDRSRVCFSDTIKEIEEVPIIRVQG